MGFISRLKRLVRPKEVWRRTASAPDLSSLFALPLSSSCVMQAPVDDLSLPSLPCAANDFLSGEPMSQPPPIGAPEPLRFCAPGLLSLFTRRGAPLVTSLRSVTARPHRGPVESTGGGDTRVGLRGAALKAAVEEEMRRMGGVAAPPAGSVQPSPQKVKPRVHSYRGQSAQLRTLSTCSCCSGERASPVSAGPATAAAIGRSPPPPLTSVSRGT